VVSDIKAFEVKHRLWKIKWGYFLFFTFCNLDT
jgi:hypothetical protein